jgi:hypothetical protein
MTAHIYLLRLYLVFSWCHRSDAAMLKAGIACQPRASERTATELIRKPVGRVKNAADRKS